MGYEIQTFSGREEWLSARKTGLGGTDTAAVMGESLWKGRHDVWMDKVGMAPEKEPTERMEWGNILEPVIAAKWREKNDLKFKQFGQVLIRHEKYPYLCCSPDRIIYPESLKAGLEIKNIGMMAAKFWGEPGTDDIATDYLLQVQKCLLVTGFDVWYVAVLVGGQEYREYVVEPDKELHELIIDEESQFWNKYVISKQEPPVDPSDACTRFLNRKYPNNNGDLLAIEDPDIIVTLDSFRALKIEAKKAEKAFREKENEIKALIGESDGVEWDGHRITWKLAKGSVSWKSLAEHLLEGVAPKERARLKQQFTGEGSRRFTPKFKEAEEDGQEE